MKFSIKQKLFLIVVLVVFGLVGLYLESSANQNKILNLTALKSELTSFQVSMLQLRRNEKDFLLRLDAKYQKKSAEVFTDIQPLITSMKSRLVAADLSTKNIQEISTGMQNYEEQFNKLIAISIEKGLDKNSGLYGKLRAETHALEEKLSEQNDFESQVLLLTLRRHEKDFMLRNDDKYLGKLISVANELSLRLTDEPSKQLLNNYVNSFERLVDISKRIGLDSKSGVRGDMRGAVHQVESLLSKEVDSLTALIASNVDDAIFQHLIVTLILSGIVIGLVVVVANQIIRPLTRFSERISEIRKGNDLTQRVEEADDEIGKISKEFNTFMAHFQTLIQSINQTVDSLSQSSAIVSKSVAKTSAGIVTQSSESDMVATAVNEMGIVAGEIANSASMTKEKTDQAVVKAIEGKDKLDNTVDNINKLSEKLIGAGEDIAQLQEKSDGITSVLEVIKAIAEQTNLLALNAAIEAARAGEHGRGFAVVADEVRTLAVRTQDSTAEITAIINELQATTTGIVSTVGICKEQGISSVSQAEDTELVLNEIIEDINAIAEMTVQVATAVEEQSIVVKDVDQNIVRIRDIGEQVALDSTENSRASEDVATLASELHEEASIFKI